MPISLQLISLALCGLGAVTSQSVLDLFISVLFLVWLFRVVKNKSFQSNQLNLIGIEWAFVGYLLVIIAGFIFNSSKDAEVSRSLLKFIWLGQFYIFIYSFENVKLKFNQVLMYFSLFFILPNLYAVVCYFLGYDLMTKQINDRVLGLVSSATYHAHGNAIIFVMFLAFVVLNFSRLSKKVKFLCGLTLLLYFASIFLTFTRGIWISIFVSAFLMYSIISIKKSLYILFASIGIICIMYSTWPHFHRRVEHAFDMDANHERVNLVMVNYKIWRDYPLLGIGFGENLRRNREYWDVLMMPEDYITSHAHNEYLNVMATTGIFGLFFVLYIFSFFLKKNWKLLRETTNRKSFRYTVLFACLWAQVEFYIACLTDVSFEYAKIRALILLVWALIIAIEKKPNLLVEDRV